MAMVSLYAHGTDYQRKNLAAIYSSQLGRSDRTTIARYLRYTDLGYGHEWCASFVSWCFGQLGMDEPRTPWSPALFPAARLHWRNGAQARVPTGQSGMVWGIYITSKRRIGHVGFIDRISDNGLIITVEGNTSAPDGKSPNGVYRKRRSWRTLRYIADWL